MADILPGVQGEVSSCGGDHKEVPRLQAELYICLQPSTMAEVLSKLPEK